MRRLLITVRDIPDDDVSECDDAWRALVDAVHEAGGRAWRFRNRRQADRLIEFIEWKDPAHSPESEAIRHALERLERIAPGSRGEWQEAPPAERS